MAPRICTSCYEPHITTDWYMIEYGHKQRGEIECRDAHEDRVRRETREMIYPVPDSKAANR